MRKTFVFLTLIFLFSISLMAEIKPITIPTPDGNLYITPLADNVTRIQYKKQTNRVMPEWIYETEEARQPSVSYKAKDSEELLEVRQKGITVVYHKHTGLISFYDASGKQILNETKHTLLSSTVQGEPTYRATLHIDSPEEEFLFGLGQFQDGYLNVRGLSRRLTQVNTQISIPFIYSSRGFGLLWNNYGQTDFNPADHQLMFSKEESTGEKRVVNVTSTEGGKQEVRESNRFVATLNISESGRYALLLDVGQKMARSHHLIIDGETVMNMKNLWLPPTASVIVDLETGEHHLSAKLEKDDRPVLYYKKVEDETVFHSPVAECVDYTVFAGEADEVIASYRRLTGNVPMMPDWALGYIHCRERFRSQEQILETTRRFRREKLPMDLIVQDWQYWGKYGWNAMCFDETHYPNPKELVDELHKMDARLMLSVWSKIDQRTEVGKQMERDNFYIKGTQWIDFFNPKAAASYWNNFSTRLLQPYGIDAWWQDATEPENDDLAGRKVMDNTIPGEVFRNVYPLLVSKTVYEGNRRERADKRTMILTRCGFPGIQRYAAALWSGDVGNDWETLRRQLTAGLNLMATGIPWWTYDAGGFFRPQNQYNDRAYHECFLRWLQLSTFLPLMRVHGYMTNTEFWNYGEEVTNLSRKALELRYSLLPYIYSANANIAMQGGTLMRPLVMDYRSDVRALEEKYQYMFGQSLLVAPILEPGVKEWKVYLPKHEGGWYDFHTGKKVDCTQGDITVDVSPEYIPVYVKAGTILPLAEVRQHVNEALKAPWEIRVYPGADGSYTVYEDEGINYNYEQGAFATFTMDWNDAKNRLTIQSRKGSYPGMTDRHLRIVKVNLSTGTVEVCKEIVYTGKKQVISLKNFNNRNQKLIVNK